MLTLLAFIFAISLLVTVHEFGHYWVARRCGVKVLVFSIGFGRPLLQWRWKETIWQIAILPLGGFVRLLGEQDDHVSEEALPYAFNRKKPWVRMLILAAGPLSNLLFAWLLYALANMWGVEVFRPVVASVQAGSIAEKAGLREGDEIIRVNHQGVGDWSELKKKILSLPSDFIHLNLEVRNQYGGERQLVIKRDQRLDQLLKPWDTDFIQKLGILPIPVNLVIATVDPNSAAAQAGVRPGDRLERLQGKGLRSWAEVQSAIAKNPGVTLDLVVVRGHQRLVLKLTPKLIDEGGTRLGRAGLQPSVDELKLATWSFLRHDNPIVALWRGAHDVARMSQLTLSLLGKIVIGEVSAHQISGPVGIAQYAGKSMLLGLSAYLHFLALLSVSLAVLNLLPIPVLDGGYLLYYGVEWIRGRPLPKKCQEVAQRVGMVFLFMLMIFAFFNDIHQFLFV